MYQKFVGKVKYNLQKPDGSFKKISEEILLEAISFTDAESILTKHFIGYNLLVIEAINKVHFDDLILNEPVDDDMEDIFVLAKIKANVLDMDSEKEKPVGKKILIRVKNIEAANSVLNNRLKYDYTYGWQLLSLTKTPFVDFWPLSEKERNKND